MLSSRILLGSFLNRDCDCQFAKSMWGCCECNLIFEQWAYCAMGMSCLELIWWQITCTSRCQSSQARATEWRSSSGRMSLEQTLVEVSAGVRWQMSSSLVFVSNHTFSFQVFIIQPSITNTLQCEVHTSSARLELSIACRKRTQKSINCLVDLTLDS